MSVHAVVPDTAGLDPATVDFELKRGVWVEGRLTDKVTGKPVRGSVDYFALDANPIVKAGRVAQQAAPGKVVANELAVRPEGMESTARKVESNTDDAIEDHFKAAIAANHWENQHIRSDAKNGVLTLDGDVDTSAQRAAVERAAAKIPGVQQVVNKLEVKGKKKRSD